MANADQVLNTELRKVANELTTLVGIMRAQNGGDSNGGFGGETQARSGFVDGRSQDTANKKAMKEDKAAHDKIRDELAKDTSELGQAFSVAAGSIESINNLMSASAETQAEKYAEILNTATSDADFNHRMIQQFGFTIKRGSMTVEEFQAKMEELGEVVEENVEQLNKSNQSFAEHTRELFNNNKALAGFVTALKLAGAEAYDVAVAAASTGGEVTLYQMKQARLLGMSHADLIKVTAQYKQTMGAAGMGTDAFTELMAENSRKMVGFTGSLQSAGELALKSSELYRLSGGQTEEGLREFISDANERFIDFQKTTGGTVDQFNELNLALRNSSSTQTAMYKMSLSQRKLAMEEMQNRRQLLINDGLRADQAQAVVDAMTAAQGGTAKDRLKNAAKLQASLGAMGMGAQGAEAADIMRKGNRASEGEKKRLQEIMSQANMEAGRRGGGSLQAEMVQDHINGLNPLLGPDSPFVAVVTQLTNKLNENTPPPDEPAWLDKWIDRVVGLGDIINNGKNDNLVKLFLGAFSAALTLMFPRIIAKLFKGVAGILGKVGTAFRVLTLVAGKILAPIAALGASFYVGWQMGTKINDYINEKFPEIGHKIGEIVFNIVEGVKGIWNYASDFVKGIPNMFATGLTNTVGVIGDFFRSIGDIFGAGFKYLKDKAFAIFDDTIEATTDAFDAVVGGVKNTFNETVDFWTPDRFKSSSDEIQTQATELAKVPEQIKHSAEAEEAVNQLIADGINKLISLNEAGNRYIAETNAKMEEAQKLEEENAKMTVEAIEATTSVIPVR